MDPRSAALALTQVATLLELHDEDRSTVRAFQGAARIVSSLSAADLETSLNDGSLQTQRDIAPVAIAALRELFETNSLAQLESLQEDTPEGLLEMLRVPGLGPAKIRAIHEGLNIETLQELEVAANNGTLAALPKFGEKTAGKIRKGIADLRAAGALVLWQHGNGEAERLRATVAAHRDVVDVAIAGSIRRRNELVRDVDLVAAIRGSPSVVAASLAHAPGVKEIIGGGGRTVTIRYLDGVHLDLACVRPEQFPLALWRATGNEPHVRAITERATTLGLSLAGDELRDEWGTLIPIASERELYERLHLQFIEPELREHTGEIDAAERGALPTLVQETDLVGALHCHSQYSDGGATIADMANAARARGWRYLGISDHSQSNTYAGGLTRDAIATQHDEIDQLNATFQRDGVNFRVLKGIEADILPCGRIDYDGEFLERFDFVIGSIHTRYGMNERQMTDRVLKALDDPHLTILGHPTGRLLLTREPYAIDMHEVIRKAGHVGVAVELNADPHRLDIDWRLCRVACDAGTTVSIGPDAHSPQGLDHASLGVGIARKGWLSRDNILNTRSVEQILAFASARRQAHHA